MFTELQKAELRKKLDRAVVKVREQAGRKLSYIEGWHAIAEANEIFGFDQWDRETVYCREVCRLETKIGSGKKDGWKVGYEAKVRICVGDVIREGTGHGSGTMTDLFDAIESAAKEAETDAMKRALMTFGSRFGLALYDKEQRNVEKEQPKARPASQIVSQSMRIAVPIDAQGQKNWVDYTTRVLSEIRAIKTKGELIAFRTVNQPIWDELKAADEKLREQISEAASHKITENGWGRKAAVPPAPTTTEAYQ